MLVLLWRSTLSHDKSLCMNDKSCKATRDFVTFLRTSMSWSMLACDSPTWHQCLETLSRDAEIYGVEVGTDDTVPLIWRTTKGTECDNLTNRVVAKDICDSDEDEDDNDDGLRTNTIGTEQNLEMIRFMQSSQRAMNESLFIAVGAVMLGVDRMSELRMSMVKDRQSKSTSFEVVKKCSFPCGKSLYMSQRRGKRRSSGGGSCICHERSDNS
ncbi:hypothetical protein AKJ16_DCAP16879, partial [Drosera capensis]